MRKAINIFTLIFFIWLVLDTFNIPSALVEFLLVGRLPGMNSSLSPNLMLALTTGLAGIIIFESLARHICVFGRIRRHFIAVIARQKRLPRRRFSQI
jgi:hypothetical protein